jgi:hypothetical protein
MEIGWILGFISKRAKVITPKPAFRSIGANSLYAGNTFTKFALNCNIKPTHHDFEKLL